jgi:hypothetical protein
MLLLCYRLKGALRASKGYSKGRIVLLEIFK